MATFQKKPFSSDDTNNVPTEPMVIAGIPQETVQELVEPKSKVEEVQQKQIDTLMEQVKILTQAADRHKLQKLYQKKPGASKIRIALYEGKIVVKWKSTKDYVRVGRNGIEEDQLTLITLEDGTSKEILQRDFGLFLEKETVSVDKTITDSEGKVSYQFIFKGKEYSLEAPFINH